MTADTRGCARVRTQIGVIPLAQHAAELPRFAAIDAAMMTSPAGPSALGNVRIR